MMILRIERINQRGGTLIRLVGQLGTEHFGELRALIAESESAPALDLEEVNSVDLEGVRFLVSAEKDGVEVRNASPYIREWMNRVGRGRP